MIIFVISPPSSSREAHLNKRGAFDPTHSDALLQHSTSLRAFVAYRISGAIGTAARGPCQRQY